MVDEKGMFQNRQALFIHYQKKGTLDLILTIFNANSNKVDVKSVFIIMAKNKEKGSMTS